MAPSYAEPKTNLDQDLKDQLLEMVSDQPAKPWTIISEVSEQMDQDPEKVRIGLRQLTLQGRLTLTSDGDLQQDTAEA
jgi:predicted transcriptional regulator